MKNVLHILILLSLIYSTQLYAQVCVECHKKNTPNIVADWQLSKHSQNDVACSTCHGEEHHSAGTVELAKIPTPEKCAECHEDRVAQF